MKKLIAALAVVTALASVEVATTATMARAFQVNVDPSTPTGGCIGFCYSTQDHTYCVYVCRS
jgi:hypothetical protein